MHVYHLNIGQPDLPTPQAALDAIRQIDRKVLEYCEKFCAWRLSDFNYEGEIIMMAPASSFYTTPGAGKNEARLAYVLQKEDLARALFILEKALEAYPGRVL